MPYNSSNGEMLGRQRSYGVSLGAIEDVAELVESAAEATVALSLFVLSLGTAYDLKACNLHLCKTLVQFKRSFKRQGTAHGQVPAMPRMNFSFHKTNVTRTRRLRVLYSQINAIVCTVHSDSTSATS